MGTIILCKSLIKFFYIRRFSLHTIFFYSQNSFQVFRHRRLEAFRPWRYGLLNLTKEVICGMKTKNAILNYQLMDVLEMHFSKKQDMVKAIKKVLLNRPIKDFNLYALFSFTLEDALVVIREGNFSHIRRLYLLNSNSETYETYSLQMLHREKGFTNEQTFNDSLRSERLAPA